MTFYRCAHCGNIITKLTDAKVPVVLRRAHTGLKAGSVDAAVEKHVPAVQVQASTVNVTVGKWSTPCWLNTGLNGLCWRQTAGFHTAALAPGRRRATFVLAPAETGKTVYAYCNLHGLWEAKL
ncbi:MAG: desulfoferrodoxin family protein [Ruthenibacterium sp.]